jgi:hypothetical protein
MDEKILKFIFDNFAAISTLIGVCLGGFFSFIGGLTAIVLQRNWIKRDRYNEWVQSNYQISNNKQTIPAQIWIRSKR